VDGYVAKLKEVVDADENEDVIGYAMAVNGKVIGADVYGSSALFRKLWPKLLRSAATEAAAELAPADAKRPLPAVSAGHVHDVLRDAETGKRTQKDVAGKVVVTTAETEGNVMFESRAKDSDAYLHRGYVTKK
jgi:hypothetical protein